MVIFILFGSRTYITAAITEAAERDRKWDSDVVDEIENPQRIQREQEQGIYERDKKGRMRDEDGMLA
jgi:hypothetical protein